MSLCLPGPMTECAFTRQWQRRSTLARRSSAHARHKDLGVGSGSSIRARSNLVHPIGSLAYRRCHPGSRPGLKFWVEDGIFMAHGELGVPFAVWHIASCIMASEKRSALHRQPNPAASQRAAMPTAWRLRTTLGDGNPRDLERAARTGAPLLTIAARARRGIWAAWKDRLSNPLLARTQPK